MMVNPPTRTIASDSGRTFAFGMDLDNLCADDFIVKLQ